ncbi:hypothetical protein C6P46_002406 [Rhodotorula mucilaginosa]|uniref:Micro-fibrillar-associated protein 1 C-terminal domain-containing protein n=1 Tax=Rhodotorula mucilaginosa TaxID=5537 RepID=A0A9P7B724_RHOMI|nr:hypothetical protein C6P46_002406 [Rhodotorula mucilaginosa]
MPPKLTQPLRPAARYRPGKAPVPVADDSDYSDQEEQEAQGTAADDGDDDDDDDQQVTEFRTTTTAGKPKGTAALNVALKQVEVDQTGKVKVGGRDEILILAFAETDSEEEQEDKAPAKPESSEYETDSEEESDEEEEPLKPIYKPVFVSKADRQDSPPRRNRDTIAERQKELDPEALEAKREEEDRKRREEAKALVADSIVREIASKEAQEVHPDVDDTDGLDPEGEFEAWKLRELTRLKRDREARYALEKIREEVEARRALPEELRIKEDTERAEKSRKEKQRGQQAFLQKYHHKGVFHQDMEILKKHDYTAPTESTITDVSSLPAVMQKRNFGKAHQTKYTHLAAEDTSRQSGGWGRPGGTGGSGSGSGAGAGAGCFVCGGPHVRLVRFPSTSLSCSPRPILIFSGLGDDLGTQLKRDCPQLAEGGGGGDLSSSSRGGAGGPTVSGANAGARVGDSGWGARRPPPSAREDDRSAAAAGAPPPGGGGRRGGIGFDRGGRDRDRDGGVDDRHRHRRPYDDDDDSRDWRDRGGRRDSRDRDRSRSRSPPRHRRRYDDDGGGIDERRREPPPRAAYDRRRSRSRSPPPLPASDARRRGYDRDRDEPGRGGGGRGGDGDRDRRRRDDRPAERERDDKRRRLD